MDFELFNSFLKIYPPGSHHTHSYYYWVRFLLPELLSNQVIISEVRKKALRFENVKFIKPNFSQDFDKDLHDNFRGKVIVDIVEVDLNNNNRNIIPNICIAELPCPVEQQEDVYGEFGGYFWINGIERVLVTQIRAAYNTPIVSQVKEETKKNHCKEDSFYTVANKHKKKNKIGETISNTWKAGDAKLYQVVVRSLSESSSHSCRTEIYLTQQGQYLILSSKLLNPLPCYIVLKALGCVTEANFNYVLMGLTLEAKKMYSYSAIIEDEIQALELLSANAVFEQPSANAHVCTPVDMLKFLMYELFPHLGLFATKATVATYIGLLISKLVRAEVSKKVDNRDSLVFKRFEPAGTLTGELFEQTMKKWISTLKTTIEKRDNVSLSIDSKFITNKVMQCFTNGVWGDTMSSYQRTGVAAVRTNTNYTGKLSQLYRVSNPISKETKNLLVRQLDNTQLNYICPCESPEGHTVGIVLNLAQSTKITVKTPTFFIISHIESLLYPVDFNCSSRPFIVLINGKIVGCVFDSVEFIQKFRQIRQSGLFDSGVFTGMVSIGVDKYEINIWSDEGRLTRPVKTSTYDGSITDWRKALAAGHTQWLDPYEQEYGLDYFVEQQNIDPSLATGITAAQIPFLNYQHAPRGVYASNMNKQAISSLGLGQSSVYANNLLVSFTQNVPLVSNCISDIYKFENFPLGNNVLCAICPVNGYNQEDAIVLNRQSIQGGLFSTTDYRTFTFEEIVDGVEIKLVSLPTQEVITETVNYCMVQDNGIVSVGAWVEEGDVLISGYSLTVNSKLDCSVILQKGEEGYVVEAGITKVEVDGARVFRVVVASEMPIVEGDKFSSRYAQKGVVGKIYDWWELPSLEDGSTCDIFMSPLALPSRMTCPTLFEAVIGQKAIETKSTFHLPLFNDNNFYKEIFKDVNSCMHNMYDTEGRLMYEKIFAGPMYYMRLGHLAMKKCYARGTGVMSKYVRQPTDGRSRNGGLRLGEMEKNVLVGYMASNILHDRLFDCSDKFWIDVCTECNNYSLDEEQCFCGSTNIKRVKCSFSANLLFSQLRALGGSIRLGTEEYKEIDNDDSQIESPTTSDDELTEKSEETDDD